MEMPPPISDLASNEEAKQETYPIILEVELPPPYLNNEARRQCIDDVIRPFELALNKSRRSEEGHFSFIFSYSGETSTAPNTLERQVFEAKIEAKLSSLISHCRANLRFL